MTSFNQLECLIYVQHSFNLLTFVYDIGSSALGVPKKLTKWANKALRKPPQVGRNRRKKEMEWVDICSLKLIENEIVCVCVCVWGREKEIDI